MLRKYLLLFWFCILQTANFAQHEELHVMPRHIVFGNKFERLRTVNVRNNTAESIAVDSIVYDKSLFNLRMNEDNNFPISLEPSNSFSFELILFNYFDIIESDTNNTIKIYNTSNEPVKEVEVIIMFHNQHRMTGTIEGTVQDSLSFLANSEMYFFYDGIILIDSAFTDADGNYSKELAAGSYLVSAYKDGYYMQYAYLKDSPLEADVIHVTKDAVEEVNFVLEKETPTDISITGKIIDDNIGVVLSKSTVIARRGKHTPTKINVANSDDNDVNRSYTVLTDVNGEYKIDNIKNVGEYYIQAFSGFYLPGYYNRMDKHIPFWQDADSIDITGHEISKDIHLARDSSYGGGMASGKVMLNNPSDTTNNSIVYALSASGNEIFSYSFSNSLGDFGFNELTFGSYRLLSQRIGFDDAISEEFEISTEQDSVENIIITFTPTSVGQIPELPTLYNLSQNYPNPFNPSTTIEFSISSRLKINLSVYNLLGQKVVELADDYFFPGTYKVDFNASNLSSGTYFYLLKTSRGVVSKKMQLLK